MATVDFRIEGVKLLGIRIQKIDREFVKKLSKVTSNSSGNTARRAKKGLSRGNGLRTGRLRASVRTRDTSKFAGRPRGLAKTVTARRGGRHKTFVSSGTGVRHTRTPHPIFGTNRGSMRPNPFLQRAQDAVQPKHELKVRAIVMQRREI